MQALVIHALNPFNPLFDRAIFSLDTSMTIAEWLERESLHFDLPTICLLNDEPILRAQWPTRRVNDGDVLAFVALPQGGGDGSNPLAIVLMIVVSIVAPPIGAALAEGMGLAAGSLGAALVKGAVAFAMTALVNAVIPAPKPSGPESIRAIAAPSPTYSLQAQGNAARLGGPIPAIYGRHLIYPDFGAQPYAEFVGNEQYLYMLFVVGQGYYDIESIRIEDTSLDVFDNVTTEIVEPGENVTLFPTNVVSSSEVVGQEVDSGLTVGPFVANSAGTLCNYLAIDVVMPRGLYYAEDNGSLSGKSITWAVEAQPINSSGTPIGGWTTLATETYSAATNTAQRASYRYAVTPGRYQVKLTRTDTKDTSSRAGHDLAWVGLRAYLPGGQGYGDITLLAVRMQASNQLSGTSSRKINLTVTRKLPTWSGGGWTAPTATRSIAWALADICRAEYGAELDDARIAIDELIALNTVWVGRGDTFNAVYDSRMGFWEALTICARAGRAVPIMQGGVIHFVRDAAQTLPVALFSMRNIVRGSFRIEYALHNDQTTDSVEADYFDETTWSLKPVLAVLPGGTSDRPAKLRSAFGMTSRAQVWREAVYTAAQNRWRRKIINFQTELEGFIPTFGDLIAISHDMPQWGQTAEVTRVEVGSNLLTHSEAFDDWANTAAVTPDGVGPNGIGTAFSIADSDAGGVSNRYSNSVPASSGSTWCASIYVKRDAVSKTTRFPMIRLAANGGSFDLDAALDTSTGECVVSYQLGTWSGVDVQAEQVGDDWYLLSLIGTLTEPTLAHVFLVIYPAVGAGATMDSAFYGNAAQGGITIWGAQLEQASARGPYVPTTSVGRADVSVLTLSEALTWESSGTHYIGLRQRDGGMEGPIAVQTGATAKQIALDTEPTIVPYAGRDEERTHVVFGAGERYRQRAIVTAVRARGNVVEISAVNEDDRVHTADAGAAPGEPTWSLPNIPTVPQIPYDGANPDSYLSVVMGGALENPTVSLSWSAAPGAERYYIEQSFDGDAWTRIGDTADTRFAFTTVPGFQYIRVAPAGAGLGAWRIWSGTVTGGPQVVAPDLPGTLVATAAGASIILDWPPHGQANVEFVQIWRGDDGIDFAPFATVPGGVTNYVDTLGLSGQTRYYVIFFVNRKGVLSGGSNTASATTVAVGGIEVVGALPSTDLTEGRVVYLTTDKKIYRYNGTIWTSAADGADLLANSVTANKVSVANLAAISANLGSITAGSLNINSRFVVDAAGNVTISNAASGARLEVRNNVIKVYDAGGVLRVKLGDLSA